MEPRAIPTMDTVGTCAGAGFCVGEADELAWSVELEAAGVGAGVGVFTIVLVTTWLGVVPSGIISDEFDGSVEATDCD